LHDVERTVRDEVARWFASHLPADVYGGPLQVRVDREEILLVGPVPEPDLPGGTSSGVRNAACAAEVHRFREATRDIRSAVAAEAEHLFGRKVSWGATCGPVQVLFTSLSVPVMTRLRLNEREVLDVLVDASIARSRSEALAWCVRLVGQHESEWLGELQEALRHVEKVRTAGPKSNQPEPAGGA
jgi:hypothetical protein